MKFRRAMREEIMQKAPGMRSDIMTPGMRSDIKTPSMRLDRKTPA